MQRKIPPLRSRWHGGRKAEAGWRPEGRRYVEWTEVRPLHFLRG